MASKYSNQSWTEQAWDWLSSPAVVGGTLIATGIVELLRAIDPSSAATLLVRFVAVFAITSGLVFVLDLLRPTTRKAATLATSGAARAWWFPYFQHEVQGASPSSRKGWFAILAVTACVVIGIPTTILLTSVQSRSVGELVLLPGQGAESFLTEAPEEGLRRSMGVKLELLRVVVDGPTPEAVVRATDMRTLAETDVYLKSADGVRVRDVVVALREIRPLGGLGAVNVRVGDEVNGETVRVERGMSVSLSNGLEVRWFEASANRLGTLGPAVQLGILRDGKVLSRRWFYLEAPELNAIRAEGEIPMTIDSVLQPSAVVLSVREPSSMHWGFVGVGLLVLLVASRLTARLSKPVLVGRNGDWIAIEASSQGKSPVVDLLIPDVKAKDSDWVQPVREEEV